MRNCVVFQENLHSWHKFHTTVGRDGRDKSQLCTVSYSGAAWEALEGLIWTAPVFPLLSEASRSPTPSSDLVESLQYKLSTLLSLCLESRVCRAEVTVVTLQSGTVQY